MNPCIIWYSKEEYRRELSTMFGQKRHFISVELEEIGSNLLVVYRRV